MAIDPEVRELLNALVTSRVQLAEGQERHERSLERHEAILAKLAEGQAKLAEGQAQHAAAIGALSDGQVRHEALLMKLAEGQAIIHERMDRDFKQVHERMDRDSKQIHERMDRNDDRMHRFEERMKELTAAIIRGFTNGAKRHDELDERVTVLEQERGS